jgi:hypothetical protein
MHIFSLNTTRVMFLISDCTTRKPMIFEMKFWNEEHWGRLIKDIKRLGGYLTGGYLVVFSANPANLTEENFHR